MPLVTVDADHPWLGLAAFTEETQRFFFGRDAEIAEIFVRVRDNTLTILYGQSGLGKSSLLGAGLLPKLRVEDYRPVPIRLRYDEIDPPLLDQVFAELEKASLLGTSRPATLWEWLHHRENRPADFDTRPPVLVFDQFEEIFTLGQRAERLEETRALFTQLAELIENRTPAALRARFQEDRRLARDYDNAPTPARLVITLREDFLSHLEQWKKILPSLMKNRMALDLLDGPQALEAVVRPGRMEGRNLVDEEVGAAIVRFVAKKEAHIPLAEIGAVPPLLSLVCDELNRLRLAQNLPTITADLVESQSSDILNNFYHESFANLPDAVRHFIEDRLITEGGHRNPVAQEDALTAFRRAGVENPAAALDQLVARRLISPEERGGLLWIEITHDVLAPLVVRSRDERLERERAAEEERKLIEEQALASKRRKRSVLILALSFCFLILACWLLMNAKSARSEARKAKDDFESLTRGIYKDAKTDNSKTSEHKIDANSLVLPEASKVNSALLNNNGGPSATLTPVFETSVPGSILHQLGLKTIPTEKIDPLIEKLFDKKDFQSLRLLSTFYMIKGANLSDDGEIIDAIEAVKFSVQTAEKALMLAIIDHDLEDGQLMTTRYRCRLGDLYLKRKSPSDIDQSIIIYNECLEEAEAQAARWNQIVEMRLHFYKIRLARAYAAKYPKGSEKWDEASRLLKDAIAHKRRALVLRPLSTTYETEKDLADALATAGEIARVDVLDFQLAVELYRESYELRTKLARGKTIDIAYHRAKNHCAWYLAQALLAADSGSLELEKLTQSAIESCEWIINSEPQNADENNAKTDMAVFQTIQMQSYIQSERFEDAKMTCEQAIDSFTSALELRLASKSINPDALWLVNHQRYLSLLIIQYWVKLNFSEKQQISRLKTMDSLACDLALKELKGKAGDINLSVSAAATFERSYQNGLMLSDSKMTMDAAKKAAAIYTDHSNNFQTIPRAKAWALGGASSATTIMAQVLGGTPPGYKPALIDGQEDQKTLYELALYQAEAAIDTTLAEQGALDLLWLIGKFNDAYFAYEGFVFNQIRDRSENQKLVERRISRLKTIFTVMPTSEHAYWLAEATTTNMKHYDTPDSFERAEALARDTWNVLEMPQKSLSDQFDFKIARLNASHNLAWRLSVLYGLTELSTRKELLGNEAVKIYEESIVTADRLVQIAVESGDQKQAITSRGYLEQGFDGLINLYKALSYSSEIDCLPKLRAVKGSISADGLDVVGSSQE